VISKILAYLGGKAVKGSESSARVITLALDSDPTFPSTSHHISTHQFAKLPKDWGQLEITFSVCGVSQRDTVDMS